MARAACSRQHHLPVAEVGLPPLPLVLPPRLQAPLWQGRQPVSQARRTVRQHAATKAATPLPEGREGKLTAAAREADEQQREAMQAAVQESLQLLEWPALCRQVACFAQTPMGAEVALRCALPVGRSRAESEQLLRQTAEAQQAQLE